MIDRKIAGCVVLYNPDANVYQNILSYLPFLDKLYIVDNSINEFDLEPLAYYRSSIEYKSFGKNLGIALALNQAIYSASTENFKWILTMDQDSCFNSNDFQIYLQSLFIQDDPSLAMITPYHNVGIGAANENVGLVNVKTAMTSGNLVNVEHFIQVGAFEEKLFIDYVDHEFCLRLIKNGFTIKQNNQIHLIHKLGDTKSIKILFFKMSYTNHNYVRRYFMTRNRLYMISNYFSYFPLWCLVELKNIFLEFFKILFFENNKLAKTKNIFLGFKDFFISKYGPYPYNN